MRRARPIIAIDGPVGAGKSTVARALARELGFFYVNTGAMYRAVAIAAREAAIAPADAAARPRLERLLESIAIDFDGERVLLNGRDVSALLAEPEVGELASRFSALAPVRARMRELQRAAGAGGGVVMEGRDIGTAVFPDAECKFYLDAQTAERARRRFAELAARGVATTLAQVAEELKRRDRRDAGRELAPLRRAPEAVVIDSTGRSVAEVVELIRTRLPSESGPAPRGLKPA